MGSSDGSVRDRYVYVFRFEIRLVPIISFAFPGPPVLRLMSSIESSSTSKEYLKGARSMPYNRRYTPNQVHDILCASDRRPRPGTLIGNAPLGHPISQHGDSRSNILDKRYRSVILLHETLAETRSAVPQSSLPSVRPSRAVEEDSRFLSRMDIIRGVCHALNSPDGQRELSKLATQPRATIEVPLDRGLNIQAETSRHPIAISGSGKVVECMARRSTRRG